MSVAVVHFFYHSWSGAWLLGFGVGVGVGDWLGRRRF